MQSLQNFETLFPGLADARAGEHEFRGRYVCAEPLLNPVPRTFAARRNPRKTASSRERRACQNVQQSLKNATGTDFENADAVPEITKNWCPGASRGRPGASRGRFGTSVQGRPGVPLGQVSRGAPTPGTLPVATHPAVGVGVAPLRLGRDAFGTCQPCSSWQTLKYQHFQVAWEACPVAPKRPLQPETQKAVIGFRVTNTQ